MVVDNQTTVTLYINKRPIDPGIRRYVSEHVFDTIDIMSDIGSTEITTEYCVRYFNNYGNLVTAESDELDDNGHKVVVVKEKGDEL